MSQRTGSERAPLHNLSDRRSSLAMPAGEQVTKMATAPPPTQDGKRSLVTVLSEDLMSTNRPPAKTSSSSNAGAQKQSFLSKFARNELKASKNQERIETTNKQSSQSTTSSDPHGVGKSLINNETSVAQTASSTMKQRQQKSIEIERDNVLTSSNNPGDDNNNVSEQLPTSRESKSFCEHETNKKENPTPRHAEEQEEDDDNDQVLPVWPSRMADAAALKPALVQHQVYSLKDYSQVAGPTESVPTSNVAASGRLLKSMSQDRKVGTRTKRMSESILSGVGTSGFYSSIITESKSSVDSRQRNPSVVSKISSTNLSMGPATSVNSLLPPNKNFNLLGESRIDRMRKLFVSPLSLRGSGGESSKGSHQASNNSRLSLQAGANMLNKPQHLMHAMYRTRVAVGTHHSRRSPMRQKQGKMKGFRVYGCPLSMANAMYPITCFGRAEIYKQQAVPYILARLCNYIEETSCQLTHEGIFRVSGNARLMDKLKTLFDHLGDAPLESESVDVATSASMLKMYLRELPEPLIPTRMNHYFFTLAKKYAAHLSKSNPYESKTSDLTTHNNPAQMAAESSISDNQSSVDRQRLVFLRDLTKLIRKLPIENYNLLKYLTCFLHRVALKQQSNKMSAEALGIVFGPNVFRIRSESYKGLKEQELGNQIMATIISNYRLIFDCELTDPLGNLVTSEENLQGEKSRSESKNTNSSQSRTVNVEHSPNIGPSNASVSTDCHPSATRQDPCPRHGSRKARMIPEDELYGDSDDSDDEEEDDDADIDDLDEDDDDDDDVECEGESYSPTSGSGSYCSSPATHSDESIYEGDIEADQYDEEIGIDSETSSRCDSETSYTPSSSHSESDLDDMSSSNFSSSASRSEAPMAIPNPTAAAEAGVVPSENPCRVCKRRESAQIERLEASRLREQMASKDKDHMEAHANEQGAAVDGASDRLIESQNAEPSSIVRGRAKVLNSSRLSTRKRRSDPSKASGKKDTAAEGTTTTTTSSDLALDQRRDGGLQSESRSVRERQLVRLTYHSQRHNHKQGVMRRRSSSASSLLRITDRHAMRKRNTAGVRDDQHSRLRGAHADRKRYSNDAKSYSRKSRNKSHLHNARPGQHRDSQASRVHNTRDSASDWRKGDYYIPELLAMNLPSEIREDLVWNYVASSFLEVPDPDRYFHLRSYNSDETLLRSQQADSEEHEPSRGRRRFSGQDFMQTNTVRLLESACPQFSEIYESLEDDKSLDATTRSPERSDDQPVRGLDQSAAAVVKSSMISLLGDQMTSFNHSRLSLDAEKSDPINPQLQVAKDIVKILRKLLKYGCVSGFDRDVSDRLIVLVADLGTGEDGAGDCSISYVDYVTGRNMVAKLEDLRRDLNDESPRVDKLTYEKLERLLSFTITNTKRRYNDLKYIREHYYKHHTPVYTFSDDHPSIDATKRTSDSESDQTRASLSNSNHVHEQRATDQVISEKDKSNMLTNNATKDHGGPDLQKMELIGPRGCKFGALCPVEFVFNMEKQLAARRESGGRLVELDEMSLSQIQSEKVELQKNLLRYEHWFGRPSTRNEFNLVGHLYERYRAIKIIKQKKQMLAD